MNHPRTASYNMSMQQLSGGGLMKLERISPNQIKYSISFEELSYKGLIEEEMFKDSFIWDALFDEMLDEANRIYELETCDAVSVEIFSLTPTELILILTLEEDELNQSFAEKYIDRQIQTNDVVVMFDDLEDCIQFSKRLIYVKEDMDTTLYVMNAQYYLMMDDIDSNRQALIALSEEYGKFTSMTSAFLEEYAKRIIEKDAIRTLHYYF